MNYNFYKKIEVIYLNFELKEVIKMEIVKMCELCDENMDENIVHTKKCQGCQRVLVCSMFNTGKKRCNCCIQQRKPKKLCIHINCKTRPSYALEGERPEYCKLHSFVGYINVNHKKCKESGCKSQPSYGLEGERAEYCKKHSLVGYIDVTHKTCKEPGCKTQPNYGKEGQRPEYCKKHSPTDYIDVTHKTCKEPGCKTRPIYGKEGQAEYCKKHSLVDYIDVNHKKCKEPGCKTQPCYGLEGQAEYCKLHSLLGYVDVVNKTCKEPGCKTRPNYGKEGESAEYCKLHSPTGYIDVTHTTCQECTARATYAFPSIKNVIQTQLNKPTHCSKHKQDGMIIIKTCCYNTCRNSALYGIDKPIHCEDHKDNDDIDLVERECKGCTSIGTVDVNGMCWAYCVPTTIYNKQHKKFQTLKQNRIEALLKKEISMDLLCVDKVIDSSCSLRRPDFVYDVGSHIVIIEVDEKAGAKLSYHKEESEKEHIRMFEISNSFEGRPLIFIRYNPDSFYINNNLKKPPMEKRELLLIKWINKALIYEDFPKNESYFPTVLTVYLYYNNYDERVCEFKELSQLNTTNGLIPCVK